MFKTYLLISLGFLLTTALPSQLAIDEFNINELDIDLNGIDFNIDDLDIEALFSNKNIFVTLLPVYGGAKINKLITQKNINDIKVISLQVLNELAEFI